MPFCFFAATVGVVYICNTEVSLLQPMTLLTIAVAPFTLAFLPTNLLSAVSWNGQSSLQRASLMVENASQMILACRTLKSVN